MHARLKKIFIPLIATGFLIAVVQINSLAAVQTPSSNSTADNAGLISFTQNVSALQARYGDILTYTIALTNTSAITPVNLLITDTLPSSLSVVPSSLWSSQGNAQYSSGVITWSDILTPSMNASISFQAQVVRANTTITNSFLVDEGSFGVYDGSMVSTDVAPIQSFLPFVSANYCTGPFIDNFSDPSSGWPIANTTYWSYGYLNGEYRFYAKASAFGAVTRGDMGKPIVEFDARQVSTVNGSYGVAFYITQDWQEFFTVEIYPATQEYSHWSYWHGSWYRALHRTSSAIHSGQGTNHLKIVSIPMEGYDAYAVYVNGTALFEMAFSGTPPQTRRVGFFASADAAGFDVRFDNYRFAPEGCPANPLTSLQRPSQLTDNLFEMQSIPSFAQRARPMVFTRGPSPVDKYPH